jgi:NAD(P)-dependent dehydrogenase (short-subunit alcohol dehydrogenase family)
VTLIDDAGHFLALERPQQFNAALTRWVLGLSPRRLRPSLRHSIRITASFRGREPLANRRQPRRLGGKEIVMLLENKNAVIYGAAGAIGSAVAHAFAREGARVFLTGRTLATVEEVAKEIRKQGGRAEAARVDALDEKAVEDHASHVASQAGSIDISFNAITPVPQPGTQGIPLAALSVDAFTAPIAAYARSQFLTSRAAARRMVDKGSGVILMNTPEPARLGTALTGGMAPAWAAMESLSRSLSAELASKGIRSVVIRSSGLPETATIDVVYGLHAKAIGMTAQAYRQLLEGFSHRRRSTTVAEVASAAVFAASDRGSGLTATVLNLTGGMIVD